MKIMWRQLKLSKLFLVLLLSLFSLSLFAQENSWEVAVVFRGENEDAQFQADVDENILELARAKAGKDLRLGIYREFEGTSYSYFPQGQSKKDINLSDLLYRKDLNLITIGGTLKKSNTQDLASFLKSFYKSSSSKKALIIYSHGKGAEGLKDLSGAELKNMLSSVPHLDLLWLDACFMANMEFLYEMREASDVTIASQEAEFSSGLLFSDLEELPRFPTALSAGTYLAQRFIESYSYLLNGKQRQYVKTSSATIAVIENKKLKNLVPELKGASQFFSSLSDQEKEKLKKVLSTRASMDKKDLVDLGSLLIELRKLNKDRQLDSQLTSLIRKLNIEAVRSLKTNPRVVLTNPASESLLVYGFNNWSDGSAKDVMSNTVFEQMIKHDQFIDGPNKMKWPSKTLKSQKIVLTPFAPGINTFNYYFLDTKGKLLTKALSVSRTHDIVESFADSALTPLAYSAYTQQIGSRAERYSGLNITMPGSVPSLDYFELEFNKLAEWLHL